MSNRPGYKHTPLGWIPEKWKIKSLSDDIEYLDAGVSVNSTDEFPKNGEPAILKTSAVNGGFFYPELKKRIIAGDINRARLNPTVNSIIISRMNTPELVGECGYVKKTFDNLFLPDRLWQTRFYSDSEVNVQWLNYLLNVPRYKTKIKSLATGTSNSMKNISKEAFLNITYISPSKKEQDKIALILSTWDEAIIKTQRLVDQQQQRNKGLMQQLLLGKKRIKGFDEPWKEIHLADAFNERNETGFVNLDLLSVGSLGVYPQSQSEKRDTSNNDKAKYKRICPGDIGYNTMRMWQGRSALSSLEGIVSPAYTIITPKERQHSEFYAYLFKLPSVVNKFFRNSQGLVEDTLNCKFKDFSIVKVEVPEYEEQVAIANILATTQSEIKFYEQMLNALQQQKKGLMQKLLMGDVRVKF